MVFSTVGLCFAFVFILFVSAFFLRALLGENFIDYFEKRGRRPPLASSIFHHFIGLAFSLIGCFLSVDLYDFMGTAQPATGEVVGMQSSGRTSAPRVTFVDFYGDTWEFLSSVSSSPPAYAVGDTVDVYYDPDEPTRARIRGFRELLLFPITFTVIGFAIIAWTMYLAHNPHRFPRQERQVSDKKNTLLGILISIPIVLWLLFLHNK